MQSRACLMVLSGHNHYVMSAVFHPKDDLVLSASLDQTIRVWDISGLRKKSLGVNDSGPLRFVAGAVGSDIFGMDGMLKFMLEGHERGVNWASFHSTMPLIVSGADDRLVKLWRYNDSKAWEVDTLRGHLNNVSCVLFHPGCDLIISGGEDRVVRVWDMYRRLAIISHRREQDRFWILAAHPTLNLLAAGHDSGLMIFKLERERPPFAYYRDPKGCDRLYYIKERNLRCYEFKTDRDTSVVTRRPVASATSSNSLQYPPRFLSYNASDNAFLMQTDDGGTYELYCLPAVEPKKGFGCSAVWLGKGRFCTVDKTTHNISVKNLDNQLTKVVTLPAPITQPDMLFYAGRGNVLVRSEEKVYLFDIGQRVVLGQVSANAKYCVWSRDGNYVAFLCKHVVVLANRNLEQLASVHESIRVKSGVWDNRGVFVYSTLSHLKYCIYNGDSGILRTLEQPVYLTRVSSNGESVDCLDRTGERRKLQIDPFEYRFKHALLQHNYAEVYKTVKNRPLCGQAIISYLQARGYPEVGLQFVKDDRIRFHLALECGNIGAALTCAETLDDSTCWMQLSREALRQGNHAVVERALRRTKNFERLCFLYLITGNVPLMKTMQQLAAKYNIDVMGQFHNTLYLGSIEDRIAILQSVGQTCLAYTAAVTHGLTEKAAELAALLPPGVSLYEPPATAQLFSPPVPLAPDSTGFWPLLTVPKDFMTAMQEQEDQGMHNAASKYEAPADISGSAWDEDDVDAVPATEAPAAAPAAPSQWDEDDDDGLVTMAAGQQSGGPVFITPSPGLSPSQRWLQSRVAADHVAAGSFDTAMQLLSHQIQACAFDGMKQNFLSLFLSTHALAPTVGGFPYMHCPVERPGSTRYPGIPCSLASITDQIKECYQLVTGGKFVEALKLFRVVAAALPLCVCQSKQQEHQVADNIGIVREYVLALRLRLHPEFAAPKQPVTPRTAELCALFTHCNLQLPHLRLGLHSAMMKNRSIHNYTLAASFARRLLELGATDSKTDAQARGVIQEAANNNSNAHKLDYHERNPFVICGQSLKPIFSGTRSITCPFCSTHYAMEFSGRLCSVCLISMISATPSTLQLS
eukprot:gnl/Spiro4/28647_TR14179_c0_g1_i1.p1 gnl/Spiro4/28647_TR14179_c0_g1~~gnl/Spiro4/28647_TR14179_c0_g1_i1.p1  ORF type:complete len:1227 (+),score=309.13 gnl/Spiro4/28647_TR14179_c0_g1_i1:421-3681(+)